jgi:hypothetical protein
MSNNVALHICTYCQEGYWDYEKHDCGKRNEPTYAELLATLTTVDLQLARIEDVAYAERKTDIANLREAIHKTLHRK